MSETSQSTERNPILPEVLLEEVASFAPTEALCAMDASSKQLRISSGSIWRKRATEMFGIEKEHGKEAWRSGVALTEPSHCHIVPLTPPKVSLTGLSTVASCSSFVAISSDSWEGDEENNWQGSPIILRSLDTFEIIHVLRAKCPVWNLTICGRRGREILVLSNGSQVSLVYPGSGRREILDFRRFDDRRESHHYVSENGIPIIGSANHLLVYKFGRLFVFQVSRTGSLELSLYKDFISMDRIQESFGEGVPLPMYHRKALCWGEDMKTFALAPVPDEIHVLRLDGTELIEVQLMRTQGSFSSLVLGHNFVAGCLFGSKRIHVFETETAKRRHILEPNYCPYWDHIPTSGGVRFDYGEQPSSLQLGAVGHLLITTSKTGNSLCVFDAKKGHLLFQTRSLGNTFRRSISSMRVLYGDGQIAVYTHHNALETAWIFPTSSRALERVLHLKETNQSESIGSVMNDVKL